MLVLFSFGKVLAQCYLSLIGNENKCLSDIIRKRKKSRDRFAFDLPYA